MRKLIERLNNEQIKNIAQAFRILGVAVCLNAALKTENASYAALLGIAWLALEFFNVITLSYLKTEDTSNG